MAAEGSSSSQYGKHGIRARDLKIVQELIAAAAAIGTSDIPAEDRRNVALLLKLAAVGLAETLRLEVLAEFESAFDPEGKSFSHAATPRIIR